MLTPVDFIHNQQDPSSSTSYVEFNTPFVELDQNSYYRHAQIDFPIIVKSNYYASTSQFSLSTKAYGNFLTSLSIPDYSFSEDTEKDQSISSNEPYIPGVRYLTNGLVVFERPPSYQIVSVYKDYRDLISDSTNSEQYYLPIPWQVYVATYNPENMRLLDVKMFFTKSSLFDINQPIYAPPIYNFFSNGKLCRPFFPSMDDVDKYPQNINGIIASAFDFIWNSGFNFDITANIIQFISSGLYTQFQKYATTVELKAYYSNISKASIQGYPSTIHPNYHKWLYSIWESIPLQEVSNIVWPTYSKSDFFYQEAQSSNATMIMLANNFLSNLGYYVHDFDENSCHCEDCCSDECFLLEDIDSLDGWREYYEQNFSICKDTASDNKTIVEAVETSIASLYHLPNFQSSSSYLSYRKKAVDFYFSICKPT